MLCLPECVATSSATLIAIARYERKEKQRDPLKSSGGLIPSGPDISALERVRTGTAARVPLCSTCGLFRTRSERTSGRGVVLSLSRIFTDADGCGSRSISRDSRLLDD